MASFLKPTEAEVAAQLKNFANKLSTYASTFGITTGQITSAQTDADYFDWLLTCANLISEYSKSVNAYKDLQKKNPGNISPGAFPVAPTLPTAPTAPSAPKGIIDRFTQLAKSIKGHTAYTDSIGQDLGIVAPTTVVDPDTLTPTATVSLVGGHPKIKWNKQGLDGIEIWKDSGSGTFVFLDFDPHPDYTDASPLPAAGQHATWKYRVIYRDNEVQIGQWSEIMVVAVTGM